MFIYVLYCLSALANTIHCGSLLSYYFNKKGCDNEEILEVLVIGCLSGCSLLITLASLAVFMHLVKQIHNFLSDFEHLTSPLKVRKSGAGKAVEITETHDPNGKYLLFKEVV